MDSARPKIRLAPITLRKANAYIAELHRHHKPARGCLICVSAISDDGIHGVAIAGRPVARMASDGYTAEVTRCCTDGTANIPSMLYRALWRAVKAVGYKKLLTYTLPEESGASLRGAGFSLIGQAGGGSWSRPGRPRHDHHPVQPKQRWEIRADG